MQSKKIQFLTRDEVLEIHKILIIRFGGKTGVRDLGLLESALYRPKTGYYKDITELSTALFESLIMNHPFIDENNHFAFFSTDVFLRLNGYRFQVEPQQAYQFLMSLFNSNNCRYDVLLPWIKKSIVKLN